MPKATPRIAALDALATFFSTADADQGLRSSWGPLADLAQGGFGGTSDPESRVTDRRFGLGPSGEGCVTRARTVRAQLAALPSATVEVLYARHGSIPWPTIIDTAFGRGMAIKVQRRVGDLLGVALLTPTVRKGYASSTHEPKPGKSAAAWANPGGWLVALCLDKSEAGKRKVEHVRAEAAALLAEAETLYLTRGIASAVQRDAAVIQRTERRRRKLFPLDAPLTMHEAAL